MTISKLPLSYCTNVHPGRTVDQVIANLEKYAVPIGAACDAGGGVGLWFANTVADELMASRDGVVRVSDWLAANGAACCTLNAFPYGDFHSERVKDAVYRPDWSGDQRDRYTLVNANILASLLHDGADGSVSTLPLGFKHHHTNDAGFVDRCIDRIIGLAGGLHEIAKSRSRIIRLAIEPEPLCVIETTDEAIDFFDRLWEAADAQGPRVGMAVRNHIGLCYDVCHQAVEYEDAARSIIRLHKAGIRINKVQISNAIEVRDPANNPEALAALRDYVDERYLHQTFGRLSDGTIVRIPDLTHEFLDDPGDAMLAADVWRVHYHVPVDQETIGPLHTTRDDVVDALTTIKKLPYAPHLEVETYTWTVMPGEKPDIVAGLAAELKAVRTILDSLD